MPAPLVEKRRLRLSSKPKNFYKSKDCFLLMNL
jgi:hypothetical protein